MAPNKLSFSSSQEISTAQCRRAPGQEQNPPEELLLPSGMQVSKLGCSLLKALGVTLNVDSQVTRH